MRLHIWLSDLMRAEPKKMFMLTHWIKSQIKSNHEKNGEIVRAKPRSCWQMFTFRTANNSIMSHNFI